MKTLGLLGCATLLLLLRLALVQLAGVRAGAAPPVRSPTHGLAAGGACLGSSSCRRQVGGGLLR